MNASTPLKINAVISFEISNKKRNMDVLSLSYPIQKVKFNRSVRMVPGYRNNLFIVCYFLNKKKKKKLYQFREVIKSILELQTNKSTKTES